MQIKKLLKWIAASSLAVLGFASIGVKTDASEGTYYSSITDTSDGETLMNSLYSLIQTSSGVSYAGLWTAYYTTDVKSNGKIWDMYSNTNFTPGTDQAGTYKAEGDVYNREHSVPQSWFSKASPMVSDLFHVYPTDGKVNGVRSDYLYGEVDTTKTISYTSTNGCMLGTSKYTISGYSSSVFEVTDEYKGDFARTYFYMATRYKDKVGSWTSDATCIFKGSYPYLTDYAIELFVKWSNEDPVSDKETARCDAVYDIQKNRNPFIDHPEWIQTIWGSYYKGTYTDSSSSTDTAVTNVISLISALPSTITLDNETEVNAANTAYLALTTSQRSSVTNYSTLQAALATISSLKSSSGSGDSGSGDSGSGDSGSGSSDSGSTDTSDITVKNLGFVECSSFSATSGSLDSYISYSTAKESGTTNPAVYNNAIRLYRHTTGDYGGSITITATDPELITEVIIGSSTATTIAYTVGSNTVSDISLTAGSKYTLSDINASSVKFYCVDATNNFNVNYLKVSYGVEDTGTNESANVTAFRALSTKTSMRFHYTTSKSDEYYEKLTDVSELKAGSEFVIVSSDDNTIGMGAASTNYFSTASVSVSDNKITDVTGLTVLNIENVDSNGYLIRSGTSYLTNTTSSNYLKTTTTQTYWTISISSGVATVKLADSSIEKNTIMYNSSSPRFSCYVSNSTMKGISIYVKRGGTSYTYSDVKLQFGGCMSKDLYEALIKEGTEVSFGVSLSLDGDTYTNYECTPVYVTAFGDTTENTSGSYVQYYAIVPVPDANYSSTIYAECYVCIDGVMHYMEEADYSINSLASYYITNATALGLTESQLAAVKALS